MLPVEVTRIQKLSFFDWKKEEEENEMKNLKL